MTPLKHNIRALHLKAIMLLAVLATTLSASAQYHSTFVNSRDSLWQRLAFARTAADSIPILYNLYDLNDLTKSQKSSLQENKQILNFLYDVGLRAGDTLVAYDAVRYLVSDAMYDVPFVNLQLHRISQFPDTPDKKNTEAFLKMFRYMWALRDTTQSDEARRQAFYDIRARSKKEGGKNTIYDKLDQQFALVLYGSNLIRKDQLNEYLSDLRRYVEMINDKRSSVKNYYYRVAAILYDENENGAKAIEMDRALIDLLAKRDMENRAEGRMFKNYDVQRFVSYRRMLGNYEHLSPDSVVAVYKELKRLMKVIPEERLTPIEKVPVEAMWLMYNKEYEKALPLLRTILKSRRFSDKPTFLLAYIRAASAVNSSDDLRRGQKMYSDMVVKRARDAADSEYAKMRIEYEIDTLVANTKTAEIYARAANKKSKEVSTEYTMYIILSVGIFLLVVLLLQILANRKTRRMADRLTETNLDLMKERDALRATKSELEKANEKARAAVMQKSEFVHNVGHELSEPVKAIVGFSQLIIDSVPEERRKYLVGFIDIINQNSAVLQRIVGDILDTADIDETVTTVTVTHFVPEDVCRVVAEIFRPRLKEDQTIVVEPTKTIGSPENDIPGIDTDATRFEQILVNLVANAVKFCDHGVITLSTTVDYERRVMVASVSDEGPGIPEGKEEIVFERFEKLGHYTDGLGLGLYICREYAHLLEGEIKVDTTYTRGARFVVILPISIHPKN